jgi:hypothetical protein
MTPVSTLPDFQQPNLMLNVYKYTKKQALPTHPNPQSVTDRYAELSQRQSHL